MRKLIYGINLTIDGCCDHTKSNGNEAILDYFAQLMREVDIILYGRKTYELMVPFWPDIAKNHSGQTKGTNDFAQAFNGVPNIVVVSRTLETVEGDKTRIVRGDLKNEILKLKQEEGKPISLGGVDLPGQLMELDLIDEYRFVVHPVLAGEGRRLFADNNLPEKLRLKLAGSKVIGSECVALHYVRDHV